MPQRLELVAGLSGVFLLAAYIAGRIYLQAYFSAFGADLRDLGFSVQDVTFASWRTLLPAFFVALLFAAFTPWIGSSKERRLDGAEGFFRTIFTQWNHPYLLAFAAIMAVVIPFSGEWLSNETLSTHLLDAGSQSILNLSLLGALWISAQVALGLTRTPAIAFASVVTALAVTLLVPFAMGTMEGHADRNSLDAGRGLEQVVVVASEQLEPGWQACNNTYFVSPDLRLLGSNSGLLTFWNPKDPDAILRIPIDRVLSVKSTAGNAIDCG